jgi:hypothetical protein
MIISSVTRLNVLALLTLAMMLPVFEANAAVVVNVDINAGATSTYFGSGAAPDAGQYFNPANPTGSYTSGALLASDGVTPTAVTFSLNNYSTFNSSGNPATFAGALFNDLAYDSNTTIGSLPASGKSPVIFSINNLTPFQAYDLYLYSQNGGYNNQTTKFTFGANSQTIANTNATGGLSSFVLNGNYVVFTGLTANNLGTIAGSFVSDENGNYATLNGFQLLEIPPPAPEPTSWALLGSGIFVLTLRRRIRS